jgi:hypothetical protein
MKLSVNGQESFVFKDIKEASDYLRYLADKRLGSGHDVTVEVSEGYTVQVTVRNSGMAYVYTLTQ